MKKEATWVNKYIDFVCANDIVNANNLKEKHLPQSLFKYRPLNKFSIYNLKTDTIWLSDIATLNDPFEAEILFDTTELFRNYFLSQNFKDGFQSQFGFNIPEDEYQKIIKSDNPLLSYNNFRNTNGIILNLDDKKQLDVFLKTLEDVRKHLQNHIRIFSASERNDSILMWSHYANQHQGICIEYETSFLNQYASNLHPANYTNELFKILNLDDLNRTAAVMASIYKSDEWIYEKEWRLTTMHDKKINNNINAPVPKAIYLGTRFELNKTYIKDQLFRICKEKGIPIFYMKIHPHEYKIIKKLKIA